MKNTLNKKHIIFDFESLFDKPSDSEKVSEKINETIFEEIMFKLFSDYFINFNSLPHIGHEFHLEDYDLTVHLEKYRSYVHNNTLLITFKLLHNLNNN